MYNSNIIYFDFKKLKKKKKNDDIVLISFCFDYIKIKKIDTNIIKCIDPFLFLF